MLQYIYIKIVKFFNSKHSPFLSISALLLRLLIYVIPGPYSLLHLHFYPSLIYSLIQPTSFVLENTIRPDPSTPTIYSVCTHPYHYHRFISLYSYYTLDSSSHFSSIEPDRFYLYFSSSSQALLIRGCDGQRFCFTPSTSVVVPF